MSEDSKDNGNENTRGYFSEILAGRGILPEIETNKPMPERVKLISKAQTERHSPTLSFLSRPRKDKYFSKAKRWVTFLGTKNIVFPIDTLKPKVQLEYVVQPGHLPRNVEIARRQRKYFRQNIQDLLLELNITSEMLVPPEIMDFKVSWEEKFGLFRSQNCLPLEVFDNEDFDCRTPTEWIKLGFVDGVQSPVPAEAFIPLCSDMGNIKSVKQAFIDPKSYGWSHVAVTEYNEEAKLYTILYASDTTNISFQLPRIYVMFKAEDPANFATRVKDAHERRKECEDIIRYNLFVDCMMFPGIPEINSSGIQNILSMATRFNSFTPPRDYRDKLELEIRYDYKRAMCDLSFRDMVDKFPSSYAYIKLYKQMEKPIPETGCVKTGMMDFIIIKNLILQNNLYVIPESYQVMFLVEQECQKAENMNLFTASYGKFVILDEFESVQSQTTQNVMKFLQTQWLETINQNIVMCLRDVGKGWFDIFVSKWYIYEVSKLSRMMSLIKFRMQSALRQLVEASLAMYLKLLETPCLCTLDCTEDFVWGDDLVTSQFPPASTPIFIVILKMAEDNIFYSTSPDMFEKILLQLFSNAVVMTHDIAQVHPMVLKNLKFSEDVLLSSVGLLDPYVDNMRIRLQTGITHAIIPLIAYSKEYYRHMDLWKLDIDAYVSDYEAASHLAEEYKDEIALQGKLKRNLEITIPEKIIIGPFIVNIADLKNFLVNKNYELYRRMLESFADRQRAIVENIAEEYKTIYRRLLEKPTSIENIFEIRDWMETIPVSVRNLDENTRKVVIEYDIFDSFWYALSEEDFEGKWDIIKWPFKINNQIDATNLFFEEERERFHKIQIEDEVALLTKIEQMSVQVASISKESDISKTHEIAIDSRRLWKAIKESQEHGQLLNQRQRLFGDLVTPYDGLNKLVKEFDPFRNFWITASDWLRWLDIWMDNPLVNVDGENIDSSVNEMYRTICKSIKVFSDLPGIQGVANSIKDQIETFKPLIPIIQALRNPGMKPRHWKQFASETGIELEWSSTLTFNHCLGFGIKNYVEAMTAISESAAKEYSIELSLNKMMNEWEEVNFEISPYKMTGTFILKISDEISQMLDDHITMTQQISYSPYRAAFESEIAEWESNLFLAQEVLDAWTELQKVWMYLEPIFTSDDINRQLPVEAKKYGTMERTWRRIMKSASETPKIMTICPDRKLLESLRECSNLLEQVQKGLSDYLETKRSVFPRFYFLSDDELLEILAQTKDPTAVQPHLRKCFENIYTLDFESDLLITAMTSAEGEKVTLDPSMYPTGNVENWLQNVEDTMKNTVRSTLGCSFKNINNIERKDWVLQWPGQVVIAGSQTHWTGSVEKGILADQLAAYFQTMLHQLDGLRELVRGPLKRVERQVLSALIVIEVHARDVTKNLLDEDVKTINDFEWISQLRYYWVDDAELKVRAVNAEFSYGYEYLGNSGRLVITPLTDRCYLTLTGALHLKFGGAPAGPAGTGKTETTKDLAKAFAIQCVVFNCSDQLDFMAMGKFFKGLASSGAWACFDEFNRIDIEVLSVIAQQITTIQKAQMARLDRFNFEGMEIALRQSCAVFITMNPGYAGRTELPDNLKALFRPVAMMVPNYALIAEISLFSFGFSDAKELAGKITTTFKLSSEQLSTQDHYDFGMRAVKTVIAVAGNLKRENPFMDEKQIVLRSLRDVNVPKFLRDDLKLFNGIVSDLFPRMVEQAIDYGDLQTSLCDACTAVKLEVVPDFVKKCIQLYETTVVRHGLMLVGPAGCGKTKCYDVLKLGISNIAGKPSPAGTPFTKVHTFVLNPKSITLGQLYGEFDALTHEWTDGILASLIRFGASTSDLDKRWYIFDGPVDAVWIENMNTVLDDNKKLCLTSGEIIKLQETQTMMFEVADLSVASPATVSRCGMVYLDPNVLGLEPFVECWLTNTIPKLAVPLKDNLRQLITSYLFPALKFLRSNLIEIVTSQDNALVFSFLRLMNFRLRPLNNPEGKPPPPQQFLELMPNLLVPWVHFSLIWSIGATCNGDSRKLFSEWLRDKISSLEHFEFPPTGLVYDYKLHDGGFTNPTPDGDPQPPQWQHWLSDVEEYIITSDMKFEDIEVPTLDSVRSKALLTILVTCENQVVGIGPTGTGKSITIASALSRSLPRRFLCEFLAFSARTSSNQTQDLIDSKLDKRRKGVFGPPVMKKLIFFIDDLNMPALETYGAQPPIELLRQWMDFGGWYDLKSIGEFRTIIDVIFVGAMGPPGGGRNPVTARLLRHFHFLSFPELEDSSKVNMFGVIISSWLSHSSNIAHNLDKKIVMTTLKVYSQIEQELRPTPDRTHYTFNLRDLARVFQGLLMHTAEGLLDIAHFLRLWYHECCRVFQDRLVNDQDRNWFNDLLHERINIDFEQDSNEVLGNQDILFGDFMDSTSDDRPYLEITNMEKLSAILDESLLDYNSSTTAPMKLVLFADAVKHVCRIARVLRLPRGHALLLGVAGSGRRSLARLSTHTAELACSEIQMSRGYSISDWREDIKVMLMRAGVQGRKTSFLFADTQIKTEAFLEDMNGILNSGDVPNIYAVEDLEIIYQKMRGTVQEQGLPPTPANLFAAYIHHVRGTLHVVVSMSPIGEVFRARLRQFPSLINCCTIDWFSAWPESALQSVAMQFLDDMPTLDVIDSVRNGIIVTCQFMHQSAASASDLYLQELNRHNYVTPTAYLELLASFQQLWDRKRGEVQIAIKRLKTGLDKLETTGEEVKQLQVDLQAMKPALEKAAIETAQMLGKIAEDTKVAEETKKVVEKEESQATAKAEETQAIAADAQRDLDEAMPMLEAAEQSLKSLNKGDISEVRALKRPPVGVHLVIEAICIVKDVKPIKVPGTKLGEKVLDYWEPGRGLLANPDQFLASLMNFDRESITEEIVSKLQPYVEDPQFQPSKIITVSKACTSLCMWTHAIYKYYFVNKAVAPKKAALAQAKVELAETERALAAANARMKEVLDGLDLLQVTLEKTEAHKAELEAKMKLCEDRMNRAVRLISGLADEKDRWAITIKNLAKSFESVVGDVLISAGAVAYLTPFTDKYRRGLIDEWLALLVERSVPHTPGILPVTTLGDPVLIRTWQICGLPRDALSAENAVLSANSRRWPLFIDPQGQANHWVRNMGKESGIAIARLSDSDLLRTLESAIRLGKSCLIENVGIEVDPALDPILLRQVFRQGGTYMLKIGDSVLPYNFDFKLYMTTKLPNPHYSPELAGKVMLVNFTLVPSGLQDQLLALVVMQERPDLEEARSSLIVSSAQMKNDLKDIEDRILLRLSVSEGSPVDDIDLIITLEASKIKSEEIKQKVIAAEETQQNIDATRALYIPVANRAQILFFCLSDLSNVDPMYQYSLEWFVNIFSGSMTNTEKCDDINVRVKSINDYFTFSLYSNVCRSLFEKHKMHFAFLLCVRILMDEGKIDYHEWHHLLSGGSPLQELENPDPSWLSAKSWKEILSLEVLPKFKYLVYTFSHDIETYKIIFDSTEPHRERLPEPWEKKLDDFQHLLVLKALRPDKVTNSMQLYLRKHLGDQFVEPQTTELSAMYKESTSSIPLVFVLSTGTDPAADLYKFADVMKMGKRLNVISLGQGQGPLAEVMLLNALENGNWVFFQNCHLAPSWMPRLERLIETISPDTAHKEFRVWLTSTPSPHFPVSILQNGSKMTVEPPRGVKANMMRAYMNQVVEMESYLNSDGEKVPIFKLLLFSLCLFHGVCIERRKFGPLGFNIPYEFTDGDLRICISQLHMFIEEYEETPFKVLTYTAGHINYGGRVTDDWDRRCIMNVLGDYYKAQVCESNYGFDEEGLYHQLPEDATLSDYVSYIRTLPLNDEPSLFGLHSNADISYAQSETYYCLSTLLALQPRVVGGAAQSQEEVTSERARSIMNQVPHIFNLEAIMEKYPVMYEESLNTVLVQEVIRFNNLLRIIHSSLQEMMRALKGLVVMSEALESMALSLFTNVVPKIWANKAYPSLKPLGAWVKDLIARIQFLQSWIDDGIPMTFWISGFYFPQAFLTGTLQNYARKYVISIDVITFSFRILNNPPQQKPKDGCCVWGLFLEGARWSSKKNAISESKPKELYTEMPTVWLIPEPNHITVEVGIYECPVYKTLTRAGTLSTTGHSTNYVVTIEIPSSKPQRHWIKRGVALICALDY